MTTDSENNYESRSPDLSRALDLLQVALYSMRDRGLRVSRVDCDEDGAIKDIYAHPHLRNSGSTFTDQIEERGKLHGG